MVAAAAQWWSKGGQPSQSSALPYEPHTGRVVSASSNWIRDCTVKPLKMQAGTPATLVVPATASALLANKDV